MSSSPMAAPPWWGRTGYRLPATPRTSRSPNHEVIANQHRHSPKLRRRKTGKMCRGLATFRGKPANFVVATDFLPVPPEHETTCYRPVRPFPTGRCTPPNTCDVAPPQSRVGSTSASPLRAGGSSHPLSWTPHQFKSPSVSSGRQSTSHFCGLPFRPWAPARKYFGPPVPALLGWQSKINDSTLQLAGSYPDGVRVSNQLTGCPHGKEQSQPECAPPGFRRRDSPH
jgi:hypothetical protein